ncbi:MAG: hypothetical protein KatS3mg129_0920 [Leptospiraceae bacterium]|nr:MAG: hypothetical protein KatS3mg129_0920 [Leptospiraceae bacterium]
MEITSKQLLNSAQNFIKRKELNLKSNTFTTNHISQKSSIENPKILEIYENLKDIQNIYTKEQARFHYLMNSPESINENLKFNNELLFPELKTEQKIDKEELLNKTKKRIEDLKIKLKKLEIEQENYFAVNFISPKDLNLEQLSLNLTKLNPDRVSQLTRNHFTG